MNLNKVVLVGRLTSTPEIKTISSGQQVCSFGLATNRVWTNQATKQREEKTEFHNIVLWGKLAEIASQYLNKGSLTLIEGRLQTRSWQDQSSGSKKYRTEIVGESLQMGPRMNSQQNTSTPVQKTSMASAEIPVIEEPIEIKDKKNNQDDEEIRVEDIPF